MNISQDVIIQNMLYIFISLALFATCWTANLLVSLWYNMGSKKEMFDIDRFNLGCLKLVALVVGMGLLVFTFTIAPEYFIMLGMEVPADLAAAFNIVGFAGIVLTGAMTYGIQALETIIDIFRDNKQIK